MTKLPFDEARLTSTGLLFPDQFEDHTRFAFHGTSIAYASGIESLGFDKDFCPFDPMELEAIADSVTQADPKLSEMLRSHAQKTTRLSFSPVSWIPIDYTTRGGGQIVQMVRRAVNYGAQISEQSQALIESLEQSGGCVYAVDFNEVVARQATTEIITIYSGISIPASAIAARIDIPRHFDHRVLNAVQSKPSPSILAMTPGKLANRFM